MVGAALGALSLACLLVPARGAGTPPQKRAAAQAQFARAQALRGALDDQPPEDRTAEAYSRVIEAYRRVYLLAPDAPQATPALVAVAELYREMGRAFGPRYFRAAIDTYQFLLHEYPGSRHREEALFAVGLIQRDDLHQPVAAEKTFREFLRLFPDSPRAGEARLAFPEPSAARSQQGGPDSRERITEAEDSDPNRRVPHVTAIHHWNAESYTRVVIDLEGAVKYDSLRSPNPDRIFFDLHKARLSPTLVEKTLEVGDGFLKAIRVAQNQAGVVRVVLDLDKVKDYSAFLLPGPYRLVIDVRGESATETKPASATTVSPAEEESGPKANSGEAERVSAAPTSRGKSSPATRGAAAKGRTLVPQPARNAERSLTRALGLKIGRFVIDAGHGGHDTGTIGASGLMEKDLCLDVAQRLGKLIRARLPGAEVIYTRTDDTFIPLENRTAIANQEKADLFISIHANSSQDHSARGIETYYLNFAASSDALEVAARENALSQSSIHELQDLIKKIARHEKVEESRELALSLQDSLVAHLRRTRAGAPTSRGVKKAPFVVLIGANMPSVLSEISFLSNPSDERLLKRPEQRQRIALGLFAGIEKYLASLNSLSYNLPKLSSGGRKVGSQ